MSIEMASLRKKIMDNFGYGISQYQFFKENFF